MTARSTSASGIVSGSAPAPYRLDGREADMCHLRKRISCPRDHESTDAAAQRKQRILDSDARHRVGGVSEVES